MNDPDAGTGAPDAGDQTSDAGPTLPLERPYAGGNPNGLALADGHAYVTVGSHVEIWNLANPAQPVREQQTAPVGTLLGSIAVNGDRAYVVQSLDLESVIHVLDISDPAAPADLGTFRAIDSGAGTSVILDLAVANGKLYAADMEQGIHVFDVSNPDEPTKVALIAGVGISSVQPEGDRLYYFSEGFAGGWFGILDAANGYAELGGTSLFDAKAARFVNGLLVTIGTDGIQVFQFDPANPWTTTEVYRFDSAFARAMTSSGTTAWIPGFDGLHVMDLSDPAAISHVGPLSFPTAEGDAIAVADGLLVTATGRGLLVAIDVSAVSAPVSDSVTRLSVCTNCASLATTQDGTLFIADVASGLKTARVRDLGELGRGTVPEQMAMEDVAVSNGRACLSDCFYGMRIFDISNPANPALLSSMVTGGYASSIAVEGNRVIVGETTNGGMIRVIDVSLLGGTGVEAQLHLLMHQLGTDLVPASVPAHRAGVVHRPFGAVEGKARRGRCRAAARADGRTARASAPSTRGRWCRASARGSRTPATRGASPRARRWEWAHPATRPPPRRARSYASAQWSLSPPRHRVRRAAAGCRARRR